MIKRFDVFLGGVAVGAERDYSEHGELVDAEIAEGLYRALEGLLNALPSATTHQAIQAARKAMADARGGK